jgi:hypothetical protein
VSAVDGRTAAVVGRAVALLFAVVWGFFVAFNVVFSDVEGTSEMLWALFYVFGAYAALGLAFGAAGPCTGWRWMWWLSVPGVLLVMMTLSDRPDRLAYHGAVVLSVLGGSAAGAWAGGRLGVWLRNRFSRGRATP